MGLASSSLQHQPSLTIPRTLRRKTVDEVWRDIEQNQGKSNDEKKPQQRQSTFGEMTLEDFLVSEWMELVPTGMLRRCRI